MRIWSKLALAVANTKLVFQILVLEGIRMKTTRERNDANLLLTARSISNILSFSSVPSWCRPDTMLCHRSVSTVTLVLEGR